MRRTIVMGVLTLSMAVAGCSMRLTQPDPQPIPVTSSPVALAIPEGDYLPLKAGSIWVMQPVGQFASSSTDLVNQYRIGTSTVSIESVEAGANTLIARANITSRAGVACLHSVGSDCPPYGDRTGSICFTKEASGLMLMSPIASASFRLPGAADGGRFIYPEGLRYSDSPSTLKVPYLQIPRTVGDLSLAATASATSGYATYNFSTMRQAASLEPEVVVAAGRFTNCLKLIVSSTTNEDLKFPNEPVHSTSSNLETVYWLAEGVGIVKKKNTYAPSYSANPYIVEEELATYSIPYQP